MNAQELFAAFVEVIANAVAAKMQVTTNVTVDPKTVADTMDNQEWFWNKINHYVDKHLDARGVFDKQALEQTKFNQMLENALEDAVDLTDYIDCDHWTDLERAIESAVESGIEEYDFSDVVSEEAAEAARNFIRNQVSVELSC